MSEKPTSVSQIGKLKDSTSTEPKITTPDDVRSLAQSLIEFEKSRTTDSDKSVARVASLSNLSGKTRNAIVVGKHDRGKREEPPPENVAKISDFSAAKQPKE